MPVVVIGCCQLGTLLWVRIDLFHGQVRMRAMRGHSRQTCP